MKMTFVKKKTILETNLPLRKSRLWDWQRAYFKEKGITAWIDQVPFYVTCNPFIAKSYVKVFLRFIQDWIREHPTSRNEPFYIVEIGAGPGRFGFYFLKAFSELKKRYDLKDISIQYIMTDITPANLTFYQNHPALRPYIEESLLDFACFDIEQSDTIELINTKKTLTSTSLKNPLSVICNYIFDAIKQDLFYVEKGTLYETAITLKTDLKDIEHYPTDWEKIITTYTNNPIEKNYYEDPHHNHLLEIYRTQLKKSHILFPIGAMETFKRLHQLSPQGVFLIASDKAFSELADLEHLDYPSLVFHGCFSLLVNFHALGEYAKQQQGDYYAQASRPGITSAVFTLGFSLKNLTETNIAIEQHFEGFSPSDYFSMHKHICSVKDQCTLQTMISYLTLSEWDPYIFLKLSTQLSNLAEKNASEEIYFLTKNIHKIAENYYFMPKAECVLFEIGVFFHALKCYEQALEYYEAAEQYVGTQFGLLYNSALCLHYLKKNDQARKRFKQAAKLDPTSKDAKKWAAYLDKIPAF